MTKVVVNDVRRTVFNELCDTLNDENSIILHVHLYYNGSNLKGTITIEQVPGRTKEFKIALEEFTKIYNKIM